MWDQFLTVEGFRGEYHPDRHADKSVLGAALRLELD